MQQRIGSCGIKYFQHSSIGWRINVLAPGLQERVFNTLGFTTLGKEGPCQELIECRRNQIFL